MIRDSQLVGLNLETEYFGPTYKIESNNVTLKFVKSRNEIILKLEKVSRIDIFDDKLNSEYIGHLK